jgi:hypothetical protein
MQWHVLTGVNWVLSLLCRGRRIDDLQCAQQPSGETTSDNARAYVLD